MADDASAAARRMRRYRRRVNAGVQVVRLEVNQDMVETLLITRQLTREQAGDPQAIAAAVQRLMKKV